MASTETLVRKQDRNTRDVLEEMTNEKLMHMYQEGVELAFEILVERLNDNVIKFIYHFVYDEKRAEDLAQDTWLRVHRNRHSYRSIAKFTTWLYTIAGNLARSEYHRKKKRLVTMESLVFERSGSKERMRPIEVNAQSLDERLHWRMYEQAAQEALETVPEKFKEVIVFRDIQQLSYEEIANITGLALGTVKSRIHRGRKALREELGPLVS